MLFEDEERAKDFCALMASGVLYIVEVSENDIQHRGDMHLVNENYSGLESHREDVAALAAKYWEGEMLHDCCVEVLVDSAIVLKRVDIPDRTERVLRQRGLRRLNHESRDDLTYDIRDIFCPDKGE
jgi:hypothetical protein